MKTWQCMVLLLVFLSIASVQTASSGFLEGRYGKRPPRRPKKDPKKTPKVCFETPDPGPCRGSIEQYHWSFDAQTCRPFTYGGCAGNGNRFNTFKECYSHCYVRYNIPPGALW